MLCAQWRMLQWLIQQNLFRNSFFVLVEMTPAYIYKSKQHRSVANHLIPYYFSLHLMYNIYPILVQSNLSFRLFYQLYLFWINKHQINEFTNAQNIFFFLFDRLFVHDFAFLLIQCILSITCKIAEETRKFAVFDSKFSFVFVKFFQFLF